MSTDDRRAPGAPRIPFDALVEVGGALGPSFEAQAVNVSEDGMQLRTAYLPETGQPLTCRFDAGPGQSVLVSGEVTWTQTAEKGGEFGIRFTDMDAESIDALRHVCGVNVQAAVQAGGKVRLHIEGLASPMRARVKDAHRTNMTVGSDLGFLQVGRQLEVEDPQSGNKRPASVDRVEVVVDPESKIPQLVVSLRYGDVQVSSESPAEASRVRPDAVPAAPAVSPQDDLSAMEDASFKMKGAFARNAALVGPALTRLAQRAKTTVALLAKRRSERSAERLEEGAGQRRTTAPPPGGGLHAAGRRVVRGESSAPALEERAGEPKPGLTKRRAVVAVGVMAVAIVGAVAMKKSHHEPVQDAAAAASAAPTDTSASPPAQATQSETAPASTVPANAAATPMSGDAGGSTLSASTSPAGSPGPSEEESADGKGAHKKHARVAPFGNGPVHHGNVLRLKMDGPIDTIEGASQPTGFTVKLPDRRSLEAAGPLASRDSRIAAIKVSNDTAGAELTVAFKDGVPNYQVSAKGDTLVIALAPAGSLETVAKKDEKGAKSTKRAKHEHEKKKADPR